MFSWMSNFMILHEDGKFMAYAFPLDADDTKRSTPERVTAKKKELVNNLMNIGMDERERRRNASEIFAVATAAYVAWAALVGDQGDFQGHILRFMSCLPLFFTVGYRKSAEEGLLNLAQTERWDVDGVIQPVDDPSLARALLEKVNKLNEDTALEAIAAAAAFAILPQSDTAPLIGFAMLFAALYFLEDKLLLE